MILAKRRKNAISIFTCLFTAVISAGAFISIPVPLSPVPQVLQDMFVLLAGLTLGASWGGASVLAFFLLGILGLPVFSGGKSGIGVFFYSPTSGFLIGYFFAAILTGFIFSFNKNNKKNAFNYGLCFISIIAGEVVIFGLGVFRFMHILKTDFSNAFFKSVFPFLPGTCIKTIILMFVAFPLKKTITEKTIYLIEIDDEEKKC